MVPGTVFKTLYFFIAYEWAQKVTVLYCTRLERLANDKHSSLLGSFVSYKENNLL